MLEEVSAELNKRQQAAETAKQAAGVKKHADALFNSPRGVIVGGREGDVNFVEFFDYNCGFCKKAMADMMELMKDDPKLRVTLKEFPVLGPELGRGGAGRPSRCACRIRAARSTSISTRSF